MKITSIHKPISLGFTLIELMITVAIVAVLAAVAYPAYTNQILKGKRAECRSGMMEALQQQERYYTSFNTYVTFTSSVSANTAGIRFISGDNPTSSACGITSLASCTTGSPTVTLSINQCVEIVGTMKDSRDPVTALTLNSSNQKGCTKSGTSYKQPTTQPPQDCWP